MCVCVVLCHKTPTNEVGLCLVILPVSCDRTDTHTPTHARTHSCGRPANMCTNRVPALNAPQHMHASAVLSCNGVRSTGAPAHRRTRTHARTQARIRQIDKCYGTKSAPYVRLCGVHAHRHADAKCFVAAHCCRIGPVEWRGVVCCT